MSRAFKRRIILVSVIVILLITTGIVLWQRRKSSDTLPGQEKSVAELKRIRDLYAEDTLDVQSVPNGSTPLQLRFLIGDAQHRQPVRYQQVALAEQPAATSAFLVETSERLVAVEDSTPRRARFQLTSKMLSSVIQLADGQYASSAVNMTEKIDYTLDSQRKQVVTRWVQEVNGVLNKPVAYEVPVSFPETPIKPGDSWEPRTISMDVKLPETIKNDPPKCVVRYVRNCLFGGKEAVLLESEFVSYVDYGSPKNAPQKSAMTGIVKLSGKRKEYYEQKTGEVLWGESVTNTVDPPEQRGTKIVARQMRLP